VDGLLRGAVASGRLKASTARKYAYTVRQLVDTLSPGMLTNVARDDVKHFIAARKARRAGDAARRVDLSALRTVLDRFLGLSVTGGLRYPAPSEPVRAATPEEGARLLAAVDRDAERLMVLLLDVAKLRPGQIVALHVGDIRPEDGVLLVPDDRPGRRTALAIQPELMRLLSRVTHGHDRGEWLFPSPRCPDRPLTVRAFQKRFSRIAGRAGVTVSCTQLRKADTLIPSASAIPVSVVVTRVRAPVQTAANRPPAVSALRRQPSLARVPVPRAPPLPARRPRRSPAWPLAPS